MQGINQVWDRINACIGRIHNVYVEDNASDDQQNNRLIDSNKATEKHTQKNKKTSALNNFVP